MKGKLIIVTTVLVAAGFFWSCSIFGPGETTTGTVSLSLTDAPINAANVTAVNITVNDVQFLQDTDGDGEGEVVSAEGFEGPKKINLLQLANGLTASLGDIVIPTGHVSQIRLILDAPERGNAAPVNPGCSIEFSDQPSETLFIPSGGSSGFKLTGAFDVPSERKRCRVTIDFDVRKSIVSTGGSGVGQFGSPR